MANIVQLKDNNNAVFYPQTHEKAVIDSNGINLQSKLQNITAPSYVVAWDGTSTPVVANIPSAVTFTFGGNTYTGTLTASSSTTNKTYLVGDNNGHFDQYVTQVSGNTYSWVYLGNTSLDLSGYVTDDEFSQLEQEVNGEETTQVLSPYSQNQGRVIRITGAVETVSSQTSVVATFHNIVPNTTYLISGRVGTGANACLVCFYDAEDSFIADSYFYPTTGTATPYLDVEILSPANAQIMRVAGNLNQGGAYPYQPGAKQVVRTNGLDARITDLEQRVTEIEEDTAIPADTHPYPFESGTISGAISGSYLTKSDNVARIRVDVPVENVAAVRIIKEGWGLVLWAAYDGDIPTANRKGESPNSRVQAIDVAGVLAASTLTFTPTRLTFVISKDDNSDLTGVTSIDDVIAIDIIDKSLYGREVMVLGDSSSDVANRDCWAKVLQGWTKPMGLTGIFAAVSSSGWSTDVTTPNVQDQWDNNKSYITSRRPIVIITSGGNELDGLQLTYDQTIALCGQTITTPSTPAEWAVYTLRSILAEKPMARIYLVSNFYARSATSGQDAKRRVYKGMLEALCDFFSITLIDLTRNSQIRGYLESDSTSSGYHIYTSDGVHATTSAGRYLIYHKIMAFVSSNEKYDV